MIIRDIVEEHADEVASLWMLRCVAIQASHYSLTDLAELDERLNAHISGLRLGDGFAWEISLRALETRAPGELFTAAILAFKAANPAWISAILSTVKDAPETRRGLVSALGWLEKAELKALAKRFLRSKSTLQRYAGIAGCALHRINPGKALDAALTSDDPTLRARALRSVGELGRADLKRALLEHFVSDEPACRYWAAWSAALLGGRERAGQVLMKCLAEDAEFMQPALQLLARILDPAETRKLFNGVARQNGETRGVTIAAGATGDPAYAPWLLKQMQVTEHARAAAEAFTMITGLDLTRHGMEAEAPEAAAAGADDDVDAGDTGMHDDEDLPWPDTEKLRTWWSDNQSRFAQGQRCLLGRPIDVGNCRDVLNTGLQRQRAAAALELALLHPETPLYETRAPGFRQPRL